MQNLFILFIFILSIISVQLLNIDFLSKLSFHFLNSTICVSIFFSLNREKVNLPYIFLNIFFLLFFLIAPLSQLTINPVSLINTLPFNQNEIIFGNILLALHIVGVILGNFGTIKKTIQKPLNNHNFLFRKKNMIFMFLITLVIFTPLYIEDILSKFSILSLNENDDVGTITNLIWNKTIKIFPLFFVWYFFRKYSGFGKYFLLFLALILLLLAKNPIVEHRNSFGAVFLFCALLFTRKIIIKKRIVQVSMFIFFPLLFSAGAFLAPHRFKSDSLFEEISTQFNTVHFDAWANYIAGFNYVSNKGFFYGEQLLGTLLFWVPRSIWETKPIGTGMVIGEYLMEKHSHWFSNISSTLPLEGYMDFGFIGIIIYGFIIGKIIKKLSVGFDKFDLDNLVSIFIVCNIFFLYRGPLLSSFAFTIGGCIGIAFISKFCQKISNISFK